MQLEEREYANFKKAIQAIELGHSIEKDMLKSVYNTIGYEALKFIILNGPKEELREALRQEKMKANTQLSFDNPNLSDSIGNNIRKNIDNLEAIRAELTNNIQEER